MRFGWGESSGSSVGADAFRAVRIPNFGLPRERRLCATGQGGLLDQEQESERAAKALPIIYAPLRGPTYPSHGCKRQTTGNPEDQERSHHKEPQSNCIGVPCNQRLHKDTWRHKLCRSPAFLVLLFGAGRAGGNDRFQSSTHVVKFVSAPVGIDHYAGRYGDHPDEGK
jgi:hypothetical protein